METNFTDSFFNSLKKLKTYNTWWYSIYNLFRREIPYFFENIWFFRKQLWNFRSWDYSYNLDFFRRSLEKTVDTIEIHGMEIDSHRMKKVYKMRRVIELLGHIKTDSYIEMAEKELGELIMKPWEFEEVSDKPGYYSLVDNETPEEQEHNKKVFSRATEIYNEEWIEIWKILQGQDLTEYKKYYDSIPEEEKKKKDYWGSWFDGSGLNGWWD